MAKRIQQEKNTTERAEEDISEVPPAKDASELKGALDDLLDEIDEILEENAEEFVRGYVQKGGE